MEKAITLIFIALLISCDQNAGEEQHDKDIEQMERCMLKNDSLIKVIKAHEREVRKDYWFDPSFDGREFKKAGIADPKHEIIQSFRNDTSLIPVEAVLGGTMHFGHVELLSDRWLIAEFDDGHIYGRALFKYELRNSLFRFELLEFLDD